MVTLRNLFYREFIIPYYLCNIFSKIPGKQLLQGQNKIINRQLIVLEQGNISDSLWFMGLIYCLEDCGLPFCTLLVQSVFVLVTQSLRKLDGYPKINVVGEYT